MILKPYLIIPFSTMGLILTIALINGMHGVCIRAMAVALPMAEYPMRRAWNGRSLKSLLHLERRLWWIMKETPIQVLAVMKRSYLFQVVFPSVRRITL